MLRFLTQGFGQNRFAARLDPQRKISSTVAAEPGTSKGSVWGFSRRSEGASRSRGKRDLRPKTAPVNEVCKDLGGFQPPGSSRSTPPQDAPAPAAGSVRFGPPPGFGSNGWACDGADSRLQSRPVPDSASALARGQAAALSTAEAARRDEGRGLLPRAIQGGRGRWGLPTWVVSLPPGPQNQRGA